MMLAGAGLLGSGLVPVSPELIEMKREVGNESPIRAVEELRGRGIQGIPLPPPSDFASSFLAIAQLRQQQCLQQFQQMHASPLTLPEEPPVTAPVPPPLLGNMANMAALFQLQMQAQHITQALAPRSAPMTQTQTPNGERKRSYPMTFQWCELCQKEVHSSKLPCHIRQCHVAKPMFQCPQCDFTSTYSKNNVKSHMVSLHGLAGDPISYMNEYAGQVEEFMKKCFPNVRGRGRPMQGRETPTSPSTSNTPTRRSSQTIKASTSRPMNEVSAFEMAKKMAFDQKLALANFELALAELNRNEARLNLEKQLEKISKPSLNLPGFGSPIPGLVLNTHNNNNHGVNGQTKVEETPTTDTKESVENVVVSSSSIDELLSNIRSNEVTLRSTSATTEPSTPTTPNNAWGFLGEKLQPKYFSKSFFCEFLNEEQIEGTIFAHMTSPAELIKLIDQSRFQSAYRIEGFLGMDQRERIHDFQEDHGIHAVNIVSLLSSNFRGLDVKSLSAETINELLKIAPSPTDSLRIRSFPKAFIEVADLSDEEKFIVQLAAIDRLDEKLNTLKWLASFSEEKLAEVSQQLRQLGETIQMLISSDSFRELINLVMTVIGGSFGDPERHLLKGFAIKNLGKCGDQVLLTGSTLCVEISHLIDSQFSHLKNLFMMIPYLKEAAKISMKELSREVRHFKDGLPRVKRELELCGHLLLAIMPMYPLFEDSLSELLTTTKDEVEKGMLYLGERSSLDEDLPDIQALIQSILSFLIQLKANFDS